MSSNKQILAEIKEIKEILNYLVKVQDSRNLSKQGKIQKVLNLYKEKGYVMVKKIRIKGKSWRVLLQKAAPHIPISLVMLKYRGYERLNSSSQKNWLMSQVHKMAQKTAHHPPYEGGEPLSHCTIFLMLFCSSLSHSKNRRN